VALSVSIFYHEVDNLWFWKKRKRRFDHGLYSHLDERALKSTRHGDLEMDSLLREETELENACPIAEFDSSILSAGKKSKKQKKHKKNKKKKNVSALGIEANFLLSAGGGGEHQLTTSQQKSSFRAGQFIFEILPLALTTHRKIKNF